ncbi:MAG: DUF3048 domain-containing protein [Candidatus Saccharimonadales bacterium]
MIDDFKRPLRRRHAPTPTKIDPQIFRPGQQEIESSNGPILPPIINPASSQAEPKSVEYPKPHNTTSEASQAVANIPSTSTKPPKKPRHPFWHAWSKKKKIISLVVLSAIVLAGCAAAAWALTRPEPVQPTVKKTVKKVTPPPVYYSDLSGVKIEDPTINDRPVTAVMIENSPDSRPQSGIDQAGIVFEAIAEGGITRFLTLYQDKQPDYLGPVRSARPYYVQWARGYDAGYAHVGGSPEALANIKAWGIKDLDQFANASAFHRISSRYAPHNMYTSVPALTQLQQQKGWAKSAFAGFARKDDAPSKTPDAAKLSFNISGQLYNSSYIYDAASNSYMRSQAGAPHTTVDAAGGQAQINPKVVVALITGYSLNGKYSQYNVVGTGSGIVFQDGTATAITWKKDSIEAPLQFVDAAGKTVKINRGQTWITALASADRVTSTP